MVPIICFEELLAHHTKTAPRPKKRTHESSSISRALLHDCADLYNSSITVTLYPVVDTRIIDQTCQFAARAFADGTTNRLPGPLAARPDYYTTGDDSIGDVNTTTTQAVPTEIRNGIVRYDLNADDVPTDDENGVPRDPRATISRHG